MDLTVLVCCVRECKANCEFCYVAARPLPPGVTSGMATLPVRSSSGAAHIGCMTTKTQLEQLDDIHQGFTILEGNMRCAITEIKEHQRTLELIILARGLLEAFPGAGLLHIEIRDGVPVPVQLTDKPAWTALQLETLEFPGRTVIVHGRTLERIDIEGWLLAELLEEISRDSDGSWVNSVDALPDLDTDVNDPHRMPKTEFDLDLAKTAALPVPELNAVTVRADRDEAPDSDEPAVSEDDVLERLREGLLEEYPNAHKLFLREEDGIWEAEDLVDSTGYGLRSGEPLGAQALPGGGWVCRSVTHLAETGYLDTLPREGNMTGILLSPAS